MNDFQKDAVVLLSGGADSATCLAIAVSRGFRVHALSFDYGQRHRCELAAAREVAAQQQCRDHRIFKLDRSQWGGSALTDPALAVPKGESADAEGIIPITYVPARNLVFLSLAAAWAETLDANDLFLGVNSLHAGEKDDAAYELIAELLKLA